VTRRTFDHPSPTWQRLTAWSESHHARHHQDVSRFRRLYGRELDREVERLTGAFRHERRLARLLEPAGEALGEYLRWLEWSGWLSAQLAPPLGLDRGDDARRLAAAVIIYLGARLVDDGMDDHRDYKSRHETFLGALGRLAPEVPSPALRCGSALAGFWVLSAGLRRLRQLGWERAADNTEQLFERIPLGALAELLSQGRASREEYRRIIARKSVAYDMILYQNLLAPAPDAVRKPVLAAVAGASEVAQYLNDYHDFDDDARRRQLNVLAGEHETGETFWASCLARAEESLAPLERAPEEHRDAVAAVFCEVFHSAAGLWGDADTPAHGGGRAPREGRP
jgi:hypothetical protein